MSGDAHQQSFFGDAPGVALESSHRILRPGDSWNGDAFNSRCLHSRWHRCVKRSGESIRPRVHTPMPFATCFPSLKNFNNLRRLTLPPLTDRVIPFAAFEAFACLESLELRNLNLEEDPANSLSALQNLGEVSFENCTLNSALVRSLATLTKLRTLGLKDIRILEEGMVDLSQVLPHQLVDLKIVRSPQLTEGGLKPIAQCQSLESLTLGRNKMDEVDMQLLSTISAKNIALELYGSHDLDALHPLGKIKNLRSLKFMGFKNHSIPNWIGDLSLDKLDFVKEVTLTPNQIDLLPSTLSDLSISLGRENDQVLDHLMNFAKRLTSLTMDLPSFERDIGLGECTSLNKLKIGARRFDGEHLRHFSSLVNLTSLQVGICSGMNGTHIQYLTSLNNLSELSICSLKLTNDACKELSNLKKLSHLSLYHCGEMDVGQLPSMSYLQSLQFGCCPVIESQLESLLTMPFISHLSFIGFRFIGEIPAALWTFCDRELEVCVNPDIELP